MSNIDKNSALVKELREAPYHLFVEDQAVDLMRRAADALAQKEVALEDRTWRPWIDMPSGDQRFVVREVRSEDGRIALAYWTGKMMALAPVSDDPVELPFKVWGQRAPDVPHVPEDDPPCTCCQDTGYDGNRERFCDCTAGALASATLAVSGATHPVEEQPEEQHQPVEGTTSTSAHLQTEYSQEGYASDIGREPQAREGSSDLSSDQHSTSERQVVGSDPQKLAAQYMVSVGLSQAKADAIALLLSRTIGFASPADHVMGTCCGNPIHVGSPEGYTLECCGNHLVSDPREAIARIIDPHSFMPDNSGEYIVGEIVKQSRELALSKADRIFAALVAAKPTHRHKKRGSTYTLIGVGRMQAEKWGKRQEGVGYSPVDMREVAIYRSTDDGSLWVRPREEFEDGRFEALSAEVEG